MEVRELAEEHWKYTEGIITHFDFTEGEKELMKYLYIEAMCHGYKHGREDNGERTPHIR